MDGYLGLRKSNLDQPQFIDNVGQPMDHDPFGNFDNGYPGGFPPGMTISGIDIFLILR